MTPNILDVYHGDNNDKSIDWESIKDQGFQAIWHKVSQGSEYTDWKYQSRMSAAMKVFDCIGGYHFLTNQSSGQSQFAKFLLCARSIGVLPKNYQVACDYERSGSTTPTPQVMLDFLNAALAAGFKPWLYGSDLVREMPDQFAAKIPAQTKLWLAEYGPHIDMPKPWSRYDTSKIIWQYSESGSIKGISGHVDLNICTGDIAAIWCN